MNRMKGLVRLRVRIAIAGLPTASRRVIEAAVDAEFVLLRAAKKLKMKYSTYCGAYARACAKLKNALIHDPDIVAYFEVSEAR
jgi:hypothetical protein